MRKFITEGYRCHSHLLHISEEAAKGIWERLVYLYLAPFNQMGQHYNNRGLLIPKHLDEIRDSNSIWT